MGIRYFIYRAIGFSLRTLGAFFSTLFFKTQCVFLGANYGERLKVIGLVNLWAPPGTVSVGSGSILISSSLRCSSFALSHRIRLRVITSSGAIRIGENVSMNGASITSRSKPIVLENDVMLGPNVAIADADFHEVWPPAARVKPGMQFDDGVVIKQRAWIGAKAVILKGVTVGENAVVAAGSIVTKDVPPNSMVAGNPARVIKFYDK